MARARVPTPARPSAVRGERTNEREPGPAAGALLGRREREDAQEHGQRAVPRAGSASIAATGTTQRWLRGAPQTMSATPIGPRMTSGIGIAAHVPPLPVFARSRSIHESQLCGMSTNETAHDRRRRAQRDRELPPLAPQDEPQQPDPRRDLRQQHERPGPRVPEPERRSRPRAAARCCRRRSPSRPSSMPNRNSLAPGQHPDRADEDRRPRRDEPRPGQQVERIDELREGRRVRVRADRVPVRSARVQVGEVERVVGAGVLCRDELAGQRVGHVDRRIRARDHEHPHDDRNDDVQDVERTQRSEGVGHGAAIVGDAAGSDGPGIETAGNDAGRSNAFAAREAFWKSACGIPRTKIIPPASIPPDYTGPDAIRCAGAPPRRPRAAGASPGSRYRCDVVPDFAALYASRVSALNFGPEHVGEVAVPVRVDATRGRPSCRPSRRRRSSRRPTSRRSCCTPGPT